MAGKSERFEMRLESDLLARVDRWAENEGHTRAGAVRELLEVGLRARNEGRPPELTDGEKLILMALADLNKPTPRKELDLAFIEKVIVGGHYWALSWEMQGIFHDHVDQPKEVTFVVDVLDMWMFIESAVQELGEADRKKLAEAVPYSGENPRFVGFDGNNETSLMSITRFLVEDMKRFSYLDDKRSYNSHMPMAPVYSRMLEVFPRMRDGLIGRDLSVDQVIELLNARLRRD